MLWSGSSPLTVVRDGMWGFLLFAGVAWLAVAWSVLRLEPAEVADVVGPVVLFGAVTEVVRALAGTRTWWLNAGMAVLFAVTGVILMTDNGESWTTPAGLLGWYLMVRGAVDVAVAMMTRETDRIWGMLTVVGLVELGLGFFAAGSFARTAETVVTVLAGAAAIRGVADLVASLRLREASSLARAGRRLELSPERAIGVAGYAAGMTDYEDAPPRAVGARHRAMPRGSAAGLTDLSGPRTAAVEGRPGAAATGHGAAGIGAAGTGAGGFGTAGADAPGGWGPGTGAAASWGNGGGAEGGGTAGTGARGIGAAGTAGTGPVGAAGTGPVGAAGSGAGGFAAGPGAAGSGTGDWRETGHGAQTGSFHDEVLRTTAELDAMLALAGVTGAAVPGAGTQAAAAEAEQVEVPDTAEGADLPGAGEAMASPPERPARAAATGAVSGAGGDPVAFDGTEPGARTAGRDDGRTVD